MTQTTFSSEPMARIPRPESFGVPAAAETETERTLVTIWEEGLNLEPVGIDDDFFDLGGDSLSATTIFAILAEDHGINLPISSLMRWPTIRELAHRVDETATDR